MPQFPQPPFLPASSPTALPSMLMQVCIQGWHFPRKVSIIFNLDYQESNLLTQSVNDVGCLKSTLLPASAGLTFPPAG